MRVVRERQHNGRGSGVVPRSNGGRVDEHRGMAELSMLRLVVHFSHRSKQGAGAVMAVGG